MRLPRVRFTVRGMMIAVAAMALVLTWAPLLVHCARSLRLANRYRDQAEDYAKGERFFAARVIETENFPAINAKNANVAVDIDDDRPDRPPLEMSGPVLDRVLKNSLGREQQLLSRATARRNYFKRMEAKRRYEAWHPWRAVAPDPPEPE